MSNEAKNSIVGSKPKVAPKAATSASAPHEYWTAERMAAAKPVPLPKDGKGKEEQAAMAAPPGPAGHIAPGHPKGGAKHEKSPGGADSGGVSVPNPKAYPYSTCGKLFFTQGSGDYAGS